MEVPAGQVDRVADVRQWVADRMRSIREARGITQRQLAKGMDVHFTRVSDFELNRSDFKLSTVLRAAAAMGTNLEQVFRGCPSWKGKRSDDDVVVISQAELREALKAEGVPAAAAKKVIAKLGERYL